MPRRSAAALATVTPIADSRPAPPPGLTEEQAQEWTALTRRLPADWFPRECHTMLGAFCKHVSTFRVLSEMLDTFDPTWLARDDGLERYNKLLVMREREGRALSSLGTRLRLTPQSRYRADKAATEAAKPSGPRPWDRHT